MSDPPQFNVDHLSSYAEEIATTPEPGTSTIAYWCNLGSCRPLPEKRARVDRRETAIIRAANSS